MYDGAPKIVSRVICINVPKDKARKINEIVNLCLPILQIFAFLLIGLVIKNKIKKINGKNNACVNVLWIFQSNIPNVLRKIDISMSMSGKIPPSPAMNA